MITDTQTGTRIDEIAEGIYRITVPFQGDAVPGGFSFSHFLIADEEPLLFHSGYRQTFPLIRQAVETVLPVERLRYIGYSHFEPDESGAVEQFLAAAPGLQPFSSQIGALIAGGGPFTPPNLGLADGQELSIGKRRLRWLSTPHVPHGWDCGILYDATTETLFCGDLFTQGGASNPPVTESDILGPSELFRKPMDYFAHSIHSGAVLDKLAALEPKLLACQHGSSYRGDGGALIRELSRVLEAERQAVGA
ncbi:MAG: MBL fold metallo-hydrolase [Bryobacteraceae bacterium]